MKFVSTIFVVAVSLPCASRLAAQTASAPHAVAPPAASAPQPTVPIVFEVSTVKVSKPGESGSHSDMSNGTYTAHNIALKNLMQYSAYGIPQQRILGGPKWLDWTRFDIEAKTDSAGAEQIQKLGNEQRRTQIQKMFQLLLADRFKLVVHWETRELPVYALVTAKNGPSLEKSTLPDGETDVTSSDGRFTARGITLEELCKRLTNELSRDLGRVVIDKTGLGGRYDVAIKWAPLAASSPADGRSDSSAAAPDTGPSIFTAIQEQLGLKLESQKGPVEILVIDHAERPSEN
jgi:uncharacterized protein (TIGR03435 family)